jgi:fumarylacetoacetate (FAA) hydrolase
VTARLASLGDGGRDGRLAVVSAGGTRWLPGPAETLQQLLERWEEHAPWLGELSAAVEDGAGEPLTAADLMAPLPRAYQYCEGSTYLSHMERCRAARGAALPPDVERAPAVLQGASDRFLGPVDPIELHDETWGLDLECTLAAVLTDTPQGVRATEAADYIRLFVLANDLTLREVLRHEASLGVGFFAAKPLRVFAPVAVTPLALGSAWDGRLLSLRVTAWVNGTELGTLDSGRDAAFGFGEVIAHAARTRPLAAGTILGTGTISNRDPAAGFGCLAEKRALEILTGSPPSSFLRSGDTVRIEAYDVEGRSVFGAMENRVFNPNGGMR